MSYIERGRFEGSRVQDIEMAHTDAGVETYKRDLGIDIRELQGQKILDIGGMPQGNLAQIAKESGIEMFTINPGIDYKDYTKPEGAPHAAGLVQELPFADESFDVELAHNSVPGYLERHESEYRSMFSEILRTLKLDGEARIYPITEAMYTDEVFEEIVHDHVDEASFKFEPMEKRMILGDNQQIYRLTITKKEKNG